MPTALVTMNPTELERLALMRRIAERRTTQREAATQLGLTVRQVERLYAAFKRDGAAGLMSKKRGAPSNRKLDGAYREMVLGIVRERYADFGPTLACEKLVELHGLSPSVETLRKWMLDDGLWVTRRQRRKRVQQPRRRRECLGELVQIDGSDHEWFEDRGPRCTLLVYVDDATGRLMELRFARSESTFDYFTATRSYLERHGKPVAFYSDKASIFRVNAKDPKGGEGFTQFGRAMYDLNIDVICANTAAAKGRVERANQTLQDRLVKEMRLRGVSDRDTANAFAPEFLRAYNARFARAPRNPHDAHRPLLPHEHLSSVFTLQESRRLTQNLTLHYKRVLYLVQPSPEAEKARGQRVMVSEAADGSVHIAHDGKELEARAFPKDARVDQGAVVSNKYLAGALEDIQRRQVARDEATLATRRLTLRDEDLLRRRMGREGLTTRRKDARQRRAPKKDGTPTADSTPLVDAIVADTLRALATPAE
jgi:transposase